MNALNATLFQWLNASASPPQWSVVLALVFGEYAIALVPAAVLAFWLRGGKPLRLAMLQASLAALLALALAQLIGAAWPHPRPFMVGLGHTLITHVADASFPSDHLTLLWAVAFSWVRVTRLRAVGIALALLGLPMAWARIYLGVHFPFDMLGALLVGWWAANATWLHHGTLALALFDWLDAIYLRLFATVVRKGWCVG